MELKEYKGMMDKIQIPENMDSQLKKRLLGDQNENKRMVYKSIIRRLVVAVVAVVIVLGTLQTSVVGNVTAAIKECFGKFQLHAGKEQFDFGEMVPVEIDFETFKSAKGTERVIGSQTEYWNLYSSLEQLERATGLHLWNSDEIKVSEISLSLDVYHQGNISCEFAYQGKRYAMNGMFMTAENKDNWGYGTKVEPYRTYSYGEGKKAYFIKDEGYEGHGKGNPGMQVIYFATDTVMYQLFVDRTEEGTQTAENIIDIIGTNPVE